jgi:hypothetical protein
MRDFAIAICALLAFLLPVGFYCLILASINRRGKPLIVSGVWDSVGLLFAVSGFFLVTMPMLVSEFYFRTFTLAGSGEFLALWLQHWILWLVYFLFLISGSALMILWRAHKTMIFNVDPELFPNALERTFANVGMCITRSKEQRLILAPLNRGKSQESTAISQAAPKPAGAFEDSRAAELQIESFPPMCHITLHWDNYAPEVRRQIENELEKSLESTAPLDNPAAGWFLNISGLIFGTLLMVALAFVILIVMSRR